MDVVDIKEPSRRFLGCPNYKAARRCNYFTWIDPELPNDWYASKMVEFRDERKISDEEIEKLKKKLKCSRMIIMGPSSTFGLKSGSEWFPVSKSSAFSVLLSSSVPKVSFFGLTSLFGVLKTGMGCFLGLNPLLGELLLGALPFFLFCFFFLHSSNSSSSADK